MTNLYAEYLPTYLPSQKKKIELIPQTFMTKAPSPSYNTPYILAEIIKQGPKKKAFRFQERKVVKTKTYDYLLT